MGKREQWENGKKIRKINWGIIMKNMSTLLFILFFITINLYSQDVKDKKAEELAKKEKERNEKTLSYFRNRISADRMNIVLNGGGSEKTELAVEMALEWLAKNQEKDGHWDSGKQEGAGTPETDQAATALALLALLGAGNTEKEGKWQENVKIAIKWLCVHQKSNGSWDNRNYANGICTLALAEAIGMGCNNNNLSNYLNKGVYYLLKNQNSSGCFDYTGPSVRDDMSISGWCILGLKTAMNIKIKDREIKKALQKFKDYLLTTEGLKDDTPTSKGLAWYNLPLKPKETIGSGAPGGGCQAVAMVLCQFLGWYKTSPWMQAAAEGQILKIPLKYDNIDVNRVYFAYMALFQIGGKQWKAWNDLVSKILIEAQRVDDSAMKGSWDKITDDHISKGGRVMYTALFCLCLESYYRHTVLNLYSNKKDIKEDKKMK